MSWSILSLALGHKGLETKLQVHAVTLTLGVDRREGSEFLLLHYSVSFSSFKVVESNLHRRQNLDVEVKKLLFL